MRIGFGKDFLWGAASSALQTEGAWQEEGKGKDIWEAESGYENRVAFRENGRTACEHYYRFREDVALMKQAGLQAYRFSVSWTRILPDGTGRINPKGLAFYSALIDALLEAGIEPVVTLYHWDYPYELQRKGGWMNPDSPLWFEEYAGVVADAFSDRVRFWITLNEPQCFTGLGYYTGVHAPFERRTFGEVAQICHHVMLAHGRAVKAIREKAKQRPQIGLSLAASCYAPTAETETEINRAREKSFAVRKEDFMFSTAWWADPICLGAYPKEAEAVLGEDMPAVSPGDMALISQPLDFFGTNIYGVRADAPPDGSYPADTWIGGPRAAEEGIPLAGYFCWSFLDNFEWTYGYGKRFGLVYVDYRTQKRTLKDSALWYAKVIEKNGEEL